MCQFKYGILLKHPENETQKFGPGKIWELRILKAFTCQNFDIRCFYGSAGRLIILPEKVS